jgi:mono/diheme cytochrome c family protein
MSRRKDNITLMPTTRHGRVALVALMLSIASWASAHDPGAPPPTWNREISRIVYERCASCHRPGGVSFSLMTYQDAQPRAIAIKTTVLARQMPPWGAVKGFGDFRNDMGLTQEQISLVTDWVEGGLPKGNNPNALPAAPKFKEAPPVRIPPDTVKVSGDTRLDRRIVLDGILPDRVAKGASIQIVAVLPDGEIEPLVWLYEYRDSYRHPFLFRKPLDLPAGTVIQGVPRDATIVLMPATKAKP